METKIKITHDPALVRDIAQAVAMQIEQREKGRRTGERLLAIVDILEKLAISKAALFRIRGNDPTFPSPLMVNRASPRWREREVDEWVRSLPRSLSEFEKRAETS